MFSIFARTPHEHPKSNFKTKFLSLNYCKLGIYIVTEAMY